MEIDAVKLIVRTKLAEWDSAKEKERLDDLERKKKKKESRKAILLLLNTKKEHNNDTQRDKEIQEQGTKAVSSGAHSL